LKSALRVLLLMAAASCSAPALQPDRPALRTSTGETSLRELQQVVSAALDGVDVTLADDALTTSSSMTIERARQRSLGRPTEPGRNYEQPQRFQLVIDGGQCFLVHGNTGLRWLLADTTCTPESGPLEMAPGN